MNTLQNQKKKWLSRARDAEIVAHALERAQEQDRQLLRRLECYEDCTDIRAHLADLQQQTAQQLTRLAGIRLEIRQCIEAVPDMQMQAVLYRKYLAYQKMEQIADEMYYDLRSIQRRHKQALDQLEISVAESPEKQQ